MEIDTAKKFEFDDIISSGGNYIDIGSGPFSRTGFDPLIGIYQMLRICKINGKVILRHHENEAVNERYEGFHKWNLSLKTEPGKFIIWNQDAKYDINELFKQYMTIVLESDIVEDISGWTYNKVIMTKVQDVEIPSNPYFEIFSISCLMRN